MSIIQGTVITPTSVAAGANPNTPCGKEGDVLISQYHGKWYNACQQGRVFHASTVVGGLAIPIYTSTTLAFCLWNTSSTVNMEIIKFSLGYVSGTEVAGPFAYALLNAGSVIGTAAPIVTFTATPTYIRSGMPGTGTSQASLANAASVVTAAIPVANIINSSLSGAALQVTASTAPPTVLEEVFDGNMILPPGWAMFPVALAASVSLFTQRVVWAEHPL